MKNKRVKYIIAFCVILVVEVLIALFAHDRFIRPYGGDILVTVLLCCLVRIFFPEGKSIGVKLVPLWVFLFSVAVEVAQYFDYVNLLGLGDIAFFRILLGTTFVWFDLVSYGIGCVSFWAAEMIHERIKRFRGDVRGPF